MTPTVKDYEITDRVMPQSPEIEQEIFGAIMLDPERLPEVCEILGPSDFYLDQHRDIFQAMIDIFEHDSPSDLPLLIENLRTKNLLEKCGGAGYLASLLGSVSTAAHVVFHAKLIKKYAQARSLIQSCTRAIEQLYNSVELDTVTDKLNLELSSIYSGVSETADPTLAELIGSVLRDLSTGGQQSLGDPLPDWTPENMKKAISTGIQRGSMIVVQAPSGKGKSTFAAQYAYSLAEHGKRVVFITREEGPINSATRAIAHYVGRPWSLIVREPQEWRDVEEKLPKWLEDNPDRFRVVYDCGDWQAIRRRVLNYHRETAEDGGVGLVVLDYLQRLHVNEERKVQELEAIAHGMKDLAVDIGCTTMLVTQQNAEGGAKWSRAVFEAADHYWTLSEKSDSNREDIERRMYLDIQKNKNGACWKVPLFWHPAIFRFYADSQVANNTQGQRPVDHDSSKPKRGSSFTDEVSDYFTENGIKHRRLRR